MLFQELRNSLLRYLSQGAILIIAFLLHFELFSQSKFQSKVLLTDCPRSQKQADLWYFGDQAGIDFRSGTAIPLLDENVMVSFKSGAVISDSLGNLLFFTDGKRVWNRNFGIMSNAAALEGDLGVTQPCIIIPVPDNPDKYYIFTIDVMAFKPDNSYITEGLKYTIIDMTMWGGLGDSRDTMNLPLLSPVCQKLTAVKHSNGKDFWVIAHEWNSDAFYSYLINSQGLSTPVVSHIGSVMGGGFIGQTNAYGYMKASPDGTKIGLAIAGLNKIELLDFNSTTGNVSNVISYTTTDQGIAPYGVEFSSDSKKLFVSLLQIVGNGPPTSPSRIYQFDLLQGFNNPVLIDSIPGERVGGMQLAVDGRIYIARTINILSKKDSLDVIYNPTRHGKECNYNLFNNVPQSRFSLDGRKSIYGLPSFIQSYFDVPMFTYDSVCNKDVTRFNITNKANVDTVLWDFGDGVTSAMMSPFHVFPQPGNYTVKLTETFNGINYSDSTVITIHRLPPLNLGDTILLYYGASIILHAGGGYTQYQWSTGSSDSLITVDKSGSYSVRVEDNHCCFNEDTVYVNLFKYYFPSSFTPNDDGRNDIFRIVGESQKIAMNLTIYDRWGQLVFFSDREDKGWDGKLGGQPCPSGTYVWFADVKFLGTDITTKKDLFFKGTVTLLR